MSSCKKNSINSCVPKYTATGKFLDCPLPTPPLIEPFTGEENGWKEVKSKTATWVKYVQNQTLDAAKLLCKNKKGCIGLFLAAGDINKGQFHFLYPGNGTYTKKENGKGNVIKVWEFNSAAAADTAECDARPTAEQLAEAERERDALKSQYSVISEQLAEAERERDARPMTCGSKENTCGYEGNKDIPVEACPVKQYRESKGGECIELGKNQCKKNKSSGLWTCSFTDRKLHISRDRWKCVVSGR